MQSAKEAMANVAASAKAGMEKTKATAQEKVDKMTAHDPVQKDMATRKKEEKITQAEFDKQGARQHNAAAKQAANMGGNVQYTTTGTEAYPGTQGTGFDTTQTQTHTFSTTGAHGQPTGGHQMSAVSGHGTGVPAGGHVTEGVVGSHPIGMDTETGRTTAQNPRVGETGTEYGTGGHMTEGVVGSHPIGIDSGMGRTTAQNPPVGGTGTGYGTGRGYS